MKLAEQTANTGVELQADPRWQLIQRVIASTAFARSSRLSSFLRFVSQRTLEGKTENLNEQEIGVKVFGRVEGYLQSDDNIVRANASRLRQKLEEYFATEGQFETLRVSLPKGGYVPEFSTLSSQIPELVVPLVDLPPQSPQHTLPPAEFVQPNSARPDYKWKLVSFFALFLLALVSVVAIRSRSKFVVRDASIDSKKSPSAHLWSSVFGGPNPTLIVPADSSLVMYQSMTHNDISLGQYINGEYRTKADDGSDDLTNAKGLARRRLTSIADLKFVAGVVPKSQQTDRKMDVRYARDLQTQDFRRSNVILLGARYSNPWVSLLDGERQYTLLFDDKARIFTIQDHSRKAEQVDVIKFHPGGPKELAYALVAYVPNFTEGKHVLILEGTTIAGTEAAVNFLLDSTELDDILAKHMLPDGSVPNFEFVLEAKDFSGTASNAKVIATRFW